MNELINKMVLAAEAGTQYKDETSKDYWEKDSQYFMERFPWLGKTINELCDLCIKERFFIRFVAYANDLNPTVLVDLPLLGSNYYDRGIDDTYRIASCVGLGYALKLAQMGLLGKTQRSYGHTWNATGHWHRLVDEVRRNQ